jgi:uncharacterized membrane protein YebE (DUF533 family)
MNTKSLLEQLLKSAPSLLQGQLSGHATKHYTPGRGHGSPLSGLGQNLGKGALASGALSMLLGNKRMHSFGSKGLKYGGLAALGVMAYRAYSDRQK